MQSGGGGNNNGCNYLFNVIDDPYQQTNLYNSMGDMVSQMLPLLEQLAGEAVDYNVDSTKYDAAKSVAAETGYWAPWLD